MPAAERAPQIAWPSRAAALAAGRAFLRGIDGGEQDARSLLREVCGVDALGLVVDAEAPITAEEAAAYARLLERRAAGEPASRILGRRAFWTLDLEVRPGVLDPRGDSEALVRQALRAAPAQTRRILDLGCGSGALLCALLAERGEAFGVGVDLSQDACDATAANLRRCGLVDRAAVLRAHWIASLAGRFDLIVSNPPYIPSAEIAGLDIEARDHDPALALDGGEDGLDAYRGIFGDVPALLASAGVLAVEFGAGQSEAVAALARQAGLRRIGVEADLGGRERAAAFVHDAPIA